MRPLPDLDLPGTVDLWIMARDESFLQGGMYQLASRFYLEALTEDEFLRQKARLLGEERLGEPGS